MKSKSSPTHDYEIDISDLISQLFKEKILILFISIICGLSVYLYEYSKNKDKSLEVKLDGSIKVNNTKFWLENYKFAQKIVFSLDKQLLDAFNLNTFIEQNKENKEIKDFEKFLKLKNLSIIEYFDQNLKFKKIPNKLESYGIDTYGISLIYPKELKGENFIINYIKFIEKKNNLMLREYLKITYDDYIIKYQNALEVSKKLGIKEPVFTKTNPNHLDFLGSDYLNIKIDQIKRNHEKLNEKKLYNADYLSLSEILIKKKSLLPYFIVGFIFGLFLSFVIIVLKNIFIKKPLYKRNLSHKIQN